jgi:hypothetical protein
LSIFNNRWNVVHDFTPQSGGDNYSYLASNIRTSDLLKPFSSAVKFISQEEGNMNKSQHLVPLTTGKSDQSKRPNVTVVFFPGKSEDAKQFVHSLYTKYADKVSIHDSKEWKFGKHEVDLLFEKSEKGDDLKLAKQESLKGPLITLALSEQSEGELGSIVKQIAAASTTAKSHYISKNAAEAEYMNNYMFEVHRVET